MAPRRREEHHIPRGGVDGDPMDRMYIREERQEESAAETPVEKKSKKKSVATNATSVVKKALQARDHVLMVRINDEALDRITALKDAGLFRSRSEAAAYLIAEGIEAKSELFNRIQEKIQQIQEIKSELQALAGSQNPDSSLID